MFRTSGIRPATGRRPQWQEKANEDVISYRCCTPMQLESILVQTSYCVAVQPDRDTDAVRSFATFTQDLNALADWLEDCGVRSVAMESTSVYWIPVYRATILVRMIPVRPGPTSIPGTSEYGWFGREVRAAKAEAQPPTVHKSKRSRKSGRSTT